MKTLNGQVKRKLEFRALPFNRKTFYLDIRSDVVQNKIARRIIDLGGKIETFLTREIHLLVTDKNEEKNPKGQRGKTDTSTQGDTSSLIQTKISFPLSRGKALLLKATQTSEGSSSVSTAKDTVQNAHSLGVRVEHFTKFLKDCNKQLQKLKQSSPVECVDRKEKLDRDFTPINWKTESRIILKVEDSDTSFKPIFKEFEKAQRLNYNSECGSPFVEGVVLRRQEKHENRYSTRKKPQNVAPKGGFCEACDYWYNCHLREHLLSDRHQDYSSNLDNFSSLNTIVNEMPGFNAFLMRYKAPGVENSGGIKTADTCKRLLGNQPIGFSSDSLSCPPVALEEIINKPDKDGPVKQRKQKNSDISWENGINNSATSVHSNDVHMQTITRRDGSSQGGNTRESKSTLPNETVIQITNVRKKLMSCSLVHHSETTDHESEKTEEYEVENTILKVSSVLKQTGEQVSFSGLESNHNSSMTEEYECTQKLNNLSSENKTEDYELPEVCSGLGVMNGAQQLAFTSSLADSESCQLSKCSGAKLLVNGPETLASRLLETSESDRNVSMMSESSVNSGVENACLDSTLIETCGASSQFKSTSKTTGPNSSHPFANITNFWQNEKSKRNKIYKKQLDKLPENMKLPLKILNKEDNMKSKKRKHNIEDDSDIPVYYSCKANGTKLKLCKVATPVRKKADIRQYWKVRKAGGCRLVFSAEKLKDFPKPPCLDGNCSPVVKRRKCLF